MKKESPLVFHNVPSTTFLRDDEIADLVNELRAVCLVHGRTQHLREVISKTVKKHVNKASLSTILNQKHTNLVE